jgi:glycolate oxidase FAD binding subunit
MPDLLPPSAEEMANLLAENAAKRQTINLVGKNSKRQMGGPLPEDAVTISTAALSRVLQYEPGDLTVSVQAGVPFAELRSLLARHGQMLAIDPPFSTESTIGGIVASNGSGPLRRAFGTVRDLVIGLTFATLEGKLVSSGGMVVKNVAGLDMGKLLIGSFGTLGAITSVNFRVHPKPEECRTFAFSSADLAAILQKRAAVAASPLQPLALDLLSPVAAARLNRRGFLLLLRAAGSESVLDRYARELRADEILTGSGERDFWRSIREFTPDFLRRQNGIVLRVSTTLSHLHDLLRLCPGASITRAGSGVTYVYLSSWAAAGPILKAASENKWTVAVEFAPDEIRRGKDLWYEPPSAPRANAFDMMKKIKDMFDRGSLLNPLRLYGRI